MNQDNKEAGSDMKFLFWDDPGDSQENVDNQCKQGLATPAAQLTQGTLTKKSAKLRNVCESLCRTATLASITLSIKTIQTTQTKNKQ
jgi:hypothetical protein